MGLEFLEQNGYVRENTSSTELGSQCEFCLLERTETMRTPVNEW